MRPSLLALLAATAVAASPAPQFPPPGGLICPIGIVPQNYECIPGKTPCDACNPCLDCVLSVPLFPGGPVVSAHISIDIVGSVPTPVGDGRDHAVTTTTRPPVPTAVAVPPAGGATVSPPTGVPPPSSATSKFWVDAATVTAASASPSAVPAAPVTPKSSTSSGMNNNVAMSAGAFAGLLGIIAAAAF
ncbi:hypothetical protein HDU88_003192 [Geranomyces variabilis]|nr:hypothetical protein HDU88_003192 [Geranomyces variabilis]